MFTRFFCIASLFRHCERSEAIQKKQQYWIASQARNDGTHVDVIARRDDEAIQKKRQHWIASQARNDDVRCWIASQARNDDARVPSLRGGTTVNTYRHCEEARRSNPETTTTLDCFAGSQ